MDQSDLFGSSPTPETLSVPDGELLLHRCFLDKATSDRLFTLWKDTLPWQQDYITIAGKTLPIPRLQTWFGDHDSYYGYSGIALTPNPWTTELLALRKQIEAIAGVSFNSLLINLYRDGQDSVSWHADDETTLGPTPTIASLSLGHTRHFQLKHKTNTQLKTLSLPLAHGDLIVMKPPLQQHWLHQVPKTRHPVSARINLTFRHIAH